MLSREALRSEKETPVPFKSLSGFLTVAVKRVKCNIL